MQSAPPPFVFPREYSFPPFFTRQTNLTTHHAQLVKWASLVLTYCRHHRIFKLSLSGQPPVPTPQATPTTTTTTTTANLDITTPTTTTSSSSSSSDELFHNRKLNRRLSLADAREVIDFLRKDGRAEYVAGGGSSSSKDSGDVAWIYWRTPEEWAALIEAWVDETGQKGSVLTLYELTQGDATRGAEFHGLDPELLQKALGTLVKRQKAQIFGHEDSQGVKFF
ncbi:ESCRT-II complex subunit [Cercophora scortea]|uniref:ESCRT-II complex subunit VPS25 n=1 Tax=Cercophora scortea TaxID=314031 RepID=A0AAE0IYV9_9PEZI|nr:ESCRT-II complex subunit [Cercophora scortea]